MDNKRKFRRIYIAGLVFLFGAFIITGCNSNKSRGPLDVKKVTYYVGGGDTRSANVYEITPDKFVCYEFKNTTSLKEGYDYFADGLPDSKEYTVSNGEVAEDQWTNLVLNLTRVNFMELPAELPEPTDVLDGTTYYIQVETSDGVNKSGGYEVAYENDSDNRRFKQVQDAIESIIKEE